MVGQTKGILIILVVMRHCHVNRIVDIIINLFHIGTAFIYTIAVSLSEHNFFQCLGKDSIYFYGLHYEVIGLAERVLPRGNCKRLEHLEY